MKPRLRVAVRPDRLGVTSCLALLFMGMAVTAAAENCQVSLDQPMIDYGQVNKTQLQKQGDRLLLGERHLQLTVQCSSSTDMVLSYLAPGAFGDVFGSAERGQYSLLLSEARLDGSPVTLGAASLRGPWQAVGARLHWRPAMQVAPLQAGLPLEGTRFVARLTVTAWLDARSELSGTAQLQGSGEFGVDGARVGLQWQASIVPAACRLGVGNDGLVDFGVIDSGQLSGSRTTTLRRFLSASVTCDGPTRFALRTLDNREPAAASQLHGAARSALFGAGEKAGEGVAWSLQFDGAILGDGYPLRPIYSNQAGDRWKPAPLPALLHTDNRLLGFASADGPAAAPGTIRRLDALLMVKLYVAPSGQLDLRDEMPIDGAATLELVYL